MRGAALIAGLVQALKVPDYVVTLEEDVVAIGGAFLMLAAI